MTSSSLFLIVAKVASLGIGFLCWLVADRLFSETQAGLASTTVSVTNLVALLAILGIGWSVIGQFRRTGSRTNCSTAPCPWSEARLPSRPAPFSRWPCWPCPICEPWLSIRASQSASSSSASRVRLACSGPGVGCHAARRPRHDTERDARAGHPGSRPRCAPGGRFGPALALVAAWTAGSVVMIAIGARQLAGQPLRYVFRRGSDRPWPGRC